MATSYRDELAKGSEKLENHTMQVIADSLVNITRDANEILKFTELNITAIRKILKKFNKAFEGLKNQQALAYLSRVLKASNGVSEEVDMGYSDEVRQAYKILLTNDTCKKVINLLKTCHQDLAYELPPPDDDTDEDIDTKMLRSKLDTLQKTLDIATDELHEVDTVKNFTRDPMIKRLQDSVSKVNL